MQLTKRFKILLSVLVSLFIALAVAAIIPFAVKSDRVYADDTPVAQLKLTTVTSFTDRTVINKNDYTTDEHSTPIYIMGSIANPTGVNVQNYALTLTYNSEVFELVKNGGRVVTTVTGTNTGSNPSAGKIIVQSNTAFDGSITQRDLFVVAFKFKQNATTDVVTSDFTLTDFKVAAPLGTEGALEDASGNKVIVPTSNDIIGNASNITVHAPSNDDTLSDYSFKLGDADGETLTSSYDAPTKTFTVSGIPFDNVNSNNVYVAGTANHYATVTGLTKGTAVDLTKDNYSTTLTASWENSNDTEDTKAGAFTIKSETGTEATSYNVVIQRSGPDTDTKGTFKLESGSDTYLAETHLGADATTSFPATDIPFSKSSTVKMTFAADKDTSEISVTYKKVGASGAGTTVTSGTAISIAPGDYEATVTVKSQEAVLDATKTSVGVYTVTFSVGYNLSGTVKITAGSNECLALTTLDCENVQPCTGGTIANADRENVKFIVAAADATNYDVAITYSKDGGAAVSAANDTALTLEPGNYVATVTVSAKEDSTKSQTYTVSFSVAKNSDVSATVTVAGQNKPLDASTSGDIQLDPIAFANREQVEITFAATASTSSISATLDGTAVNSGDKKDLAVGEHTIVVTVTAEDGTSKAYTLKVTVSEQSADNGNEQGGNGGNGGNTGNGGGTTEPGGNNNQTVNTDEPVKIPTAETNETIFIDLGNVDRSKNEIKIEIEDITSSSVVNGKATGSNDKYTLTVEDGVNVYVIKATCADGGVKTIVIKATKPAESIVLLVLVIVLGVLLVTVTIVMIVFIVKNNANKKLLKKEKEGENKDGDAEKNDKE